MNDIAALDAVFADSTAAPAGLLIGHEVGHHVQALTGRGARQE